MVKALIWSIQTFPYPLCHCVIALYDVLSKVYDALVGSADVAGDRSRHGIAIECAAIDAEDLADLWDGVQFTRFNYGLSHNSLYFKCLISLITIILGVLMSINASLAR